MKTLEPRERESTSSDRSERRPTETHSSSRGGDNRRRESSKGRDKKVVKATGSRCSHEGENGREQTAKSLDKKVVKATSTSSPERKRKRTGDEGEARKEKRPHIPCTLSKAPSEEESTAAVGSPAVVTPAASEPLLPAKKVVVASRRGSARKRMPLDSRTRKS